MARPKSGHWIDADEAIGHACAQLMHWGCAGHQVFSAVAAAADHVFGRGVGPERVRQIYKHWTQRARSLGYRASGAFTKASRAQTRPQEPIATLAERLLRAHRPGSLEKRARQRELLAEIEHRASQISDPQPPAQPDPLDDPRWFAVGGGVHPDDMNAEQRAAFEALSPALRAEYRALVEKDAADAKKDARATRERWEQYERRIDASFESLRAVIRDGAYAPPGVVDDHVATPVRGSRQRRK